MALPPDAQLLIFDLDDTLISGYMRNADRDYHTWRVRNVWTARLAAVQAAGHQVAIATNQGGVGRGFVTEDDWAIKIAAVLAALGLAPDTLVAVCFAHEYARFDRYRDPRELYRRKPAPTMLTELAARAGVATPHGAHTLYIGDQPSDHETAIAGGFPFLYVAQAEALFDAAHIWGVAQRAAYRPAEGDATL